jgi:hypothetical protein
MTTQYGSYGTRRSAACLTPIALLTSMMLTTGCAPSPYETGDQNVARISAGIRQAVDACITEANEIASAQDDKVYIDVKKYDRVIVFVPIPHLLPIPGTITALSSLKPVIVPKNAVVKGWTDHFALAQELSYRYSYVETLETKHHLSPPHFTAKITILLKTTHRWAYTGKPKGIPAGPDGYIAWWAGSFWSNWHGTGEWSGHLPAPEIPPGKVVTQSLPIDTISQSALNSLRQSPPKKSEYAVAAQMAYDHHRKRWELQHVTIKNFPGPKPLSWNHGLEGDNDHYVLTPDKIRFREPTSKPAPKE